MQPLIHTHTSPTPPQHAAHYHSHHYSGPHDNAGKTPRIAMKRAEAFETERIHDYGCCFQFSKRELPAPRSESDSKGTWGCNGAHVWRCYSNGSDIYQVGPYDNMHI
jgi:hypothetical protein